MRTRSANSGHSMNKAGDPWLPNSEQKARPRFKAAEFRTKESSRFTLPNSEPRRVQDLRCRSTVKRLTYDQIVSEYGNLSILALATGICQGLAGSPDPIDPFVPPYLMTRYGKRKTASVFIRVAQRIAHPVASLVTYIPLNAQQQQQLQPGPGMLVPPVKGE
ncbi:hypothetical protein BKA56DRAFT_623523 [Ilyonectria sp. MPI-CAGE-AT-0026]|nr:hypothetical protein BKA56DRAFT_623523 [Ilyonectria sp. MPI-CAGE-AT-0026]